MNEKDLIEILNAVGLFYDMTELKEALSKNPLNNKGKCILFSRVSTTKQDLVQQNNELRAEAIRNGYDESDIILIENKESAIKLDEEERIGIRRLKDTINNNDISCVIVYEISRIARRPKVLYSVRDFLIDNKVNLICIKPFMKLLDNDGNMSQTASILFSLFGAMSESEMMIKKERMMRGKRHKQEIGGYIGGKPLFGYKFENDILTIDYSKSEIVKMIYNMYEKGMSTRIIATELMQTGHIKKTNLNNANRLIQTILTRPEYYGGSSEISKYHYPKIISKMQYDKCREIAKDRTKEHSKTKRYCLCKKLLYCKDNGYVLTPNIAKNQYKMYTIDKKYNMSIKIDIIDKMIWELVVEHSKKYNDDKETKMQLEKDMMIAERKSQQAMRNLEDLEKQIDRIEQRIIEGKMSEAKGDRMIAEKKIEQQEQQEIFDKYSYIYGQKNEALHDESYKTDIIGVVDEQEQQKIVRRYVDKIILEKSGIKRGHYLIEVIMINGVIYKYSYWSSGPWNNIERI